MHMLHFKHVISSTEVNRGTKHASTWARAEEFVASGHKPVSSFRNYVTGGGVLESTEGHALFMAVLRSTRLGVWFLTDPVV